MNTPESNRELEEKPGSQKSVKEAQDAHSRTKDEYERLEKILEELNERMEALREESRIVLSVNNSCPVRSMFFMSRSWQESRTTVIIAAVF